MKWIRVLNLTPITDTFFIVDRLHRDIDYEFRVAAENRAGCGPYSKVFGPVKTYVHKGQSSISVNPRALHITLLSTPRAIISQLSRFCILFKTFVSV